MKQKQYIFYKGDDRMEKKNPLFIILHLNQIHMNVYSYVELDISALFESNIWNTFHKCANYFIHIFFRMF